MNMTSGKLTIVPTPIGNLGDMTERARLALEAADIVYAEDTRVTAKLLGVLGISKPTVRLDEQVMEKRAEEVVGRVLAGEAVCYCTDAGMPGVSDPGARLLAAARNADVPVEVLPGPSAVALAYVASATPNPHFYFGGFFPRKSVEAHSLLHSLRGLDAALIFYESPKRLVAALQVIAECFPYRQVAVCRELTKLHEEIVRAKSCDVLNIFKNRESSGVIKGEIVIVIDGMAAEEVAEDARDALQDAVAMARDLKNNGLSAKDIARRLSGVLGIPKNKAYEIAIGER